LYVSEVWHFEKKTKLLAVEIISRSISRKYKIPKHKQRKGRLTNFYFGWYKNKTINTKGQMQILANNSLPKQVLELMPPGKRNTGRPRDR
jgi:hypothetical protein